MAADTDEGRLTDLLDEFEAGLLRGMPPFGQEGLFDLSPEELQDLLARQDGLLLAHALFRPAPEEAKPKRKVRVPKLPGFRIRKLLGRGGMGIVFEAEQITPRRRVALKLIRDQGEHDPERRARFRWEIQSIADLDHPHIVRLYEVRESPRHFFFSQEFVEGGTLARKIAGSPQPPREAAGLVASVARAMEHAHRKGIVHRDLKPGNILLTADGHPKVADFGLAKVLGEDEPLTRAGQCLGTPQYMAPEQTGGDAGRIDGRTDVHALGAILYEMLAGRPPFVAATSLEVLEQVKTRDPLPPRRLLPSLPRDLETICLKCLEKAPDHRYGSAQALADDLQRFLDGNPIAARPVGVVERGAKWIRRHPVHTLALGFALVLLMLVPAGGTWLWQARGKTLEAERRAAKDRYFRNVQSADAEWKGLGPARVADLLADCPSEMRSWEWHHLQRRLQGQRYSLTAHAGESVYGLAFSPNDRLLATGGSRGIVRIWDAADGRLLQQLGREGPGIVGLAFDADGRRLFTATIDTLTVWDTSKWNRLRTVGGLPALGTGTLAVSGDRLALGGRHGTVTIVDTLTGNIVARLGSSGREATGCTSYVAFDPTGQRLAYTSREGGKASVRIVHLGEHREEFTWFLPQRLFTGVAFGPDGSELAVGCIPLDNRTPFSREIRTIDWRRKQVLHRLPDRAWSLVSGAFRPGLLATAVPPDGTLTLWDPENESERWTIRAPMELTAGVLGGDGKFAAAACVDGTVHVWDTAHAPGTFDLRAPSNRAVHTVAFCPDGRALAAGCAGGFVTVWDRASGAIRWRREQPHPWKGVVAIAYDPMNRCLATASRGSHVLLRSVADGKVVLRLSHDQAVTVAFSPDGRWLATAGFGPEIRLWEAGTGEMVRAFSGHTKLIGTLAFSRDGRWLISGSDDRSTRIWEVRTGRETRNLPEDHHVGAVAVGPDGRHFATGTGSGRIRIRDLEKGLDIADLRGHKHKIAGLAWSPDGKRLASASDDRTLRLWERQDGMEVLTLAGHKGAVAAVAWDATGNFLASGGWDGIVRIWDGSPMAETSNRKSPGHMQPGE